MKKLAALTLSLFMSLSSAYAANYDALEENKIFGHIPANDQILPGDKFSKADITRQTIITALLVVDYGQTMDIYKRPHEFKEDNPLVRANWSENGIRNYFIVSAVVNVAIMRAVPAEWRPVAQVAYIVAQGLVVARNKKFGINVRF